MFTIENRSRLNRHDRKRQAIQTARTLINGGPGSEQWVENFRGFLAINHLLQRGNENKLSDYAVIWCQKASAEMEFQFGRYASVVEKAFKKIEDLY